MNYLTLHHSRNQSLRKLSLYDLKRYNEVPKPQLYHSAIRLEKPEASLPWLNIMQN